VALPDSLLPTASLAKDAAARINCRIERQPRASTRYARKFDISANGLRRLPTATWPVPGEFYWGYIAAWIGPIIEFARAHVRHINSWIVAQYGMTGVEVDTDWLIYYSPMGIRLTLSD
jgi:hypothetical protein